MSATNVAHAGKRGNICVGNNVSSFARAFKARITVTKSRKNLIKRGGDKLVKPISNEICFILTSLV